MSRRTKARLNRAQEARRSESSGHEMADTQTMRTRTAIQRSISGDAAEEGGTSTTGNGRDGGERTISSAADDHTRGG